MFERDYNFKGRHANIVTQLTTEIDSDTKFKLFERNIDVLIIAPIVGLSGMVIISMLWLA